MPWELIAVGPGKIAVPKGWRNLDNLPPLVESLLEQATRSARLELTKAEVEGVHLGDGTEAQFLTAEFIKEGHRRSLQMKLIVRDARLTAWIVSGYIVAGTQSTVARSGSALAIWLRAHITSLSWDERRIDRHKLSVAYGDRGK